MNDDEMRELERKSRAAFDASVESQDAATRSRLARARVKALEELRRPRFVGFGVWVPVGAAAAMVFAALLLKGEVPGEQESPAGVAVALEDLEIVAGGEDFEMLREDEDFLAWAAEESADGVG
jgi:hypothetical protein